MTRRPVTAAAVDVVADIATGIKFRQGCIATQPKLRRRSNAALPLVTNFPRAYTRQIFHRPIGLVPF
jgi:hypothetical protein